MKPDPQVAAAMLDLLERRLAEAASERQRFADLFHFAPEPYLVTDSHGAITEANRAAGELLGMRPDLLRDKPLAAFLPVAARGEFRRRLNALRARGAGGAARWLAAVHRIRLEEV